MLKVVILIDALLSSVMPKVIKLSVIMLSVLILCIILLSVNMLSVIMLNAVMLLSAPFINTLECPNHLTTFKVPARIEL